MSEQPQRSRRVKNLGLSLLFVVFLLAGAIAAAQLVHESSASAEASDHVSIKGVDFDDDDDYRGGRSRDPYYSDGGCGGAGCAGCLGASSSGLLVFGVAAFAATRFLP